MALAAIERQSRPTQAARVSSLRHETALVGLPPPIGGAAKTSPGEGSPGLVICGLPLDVSDAGGESWGLVSASEEGDDLGRPDRVVSRHLRSMVARALASTGCGRPVSVSPFSGRTLFSGVP
jgi:hypothetical protein